MEIQRNELAIGRRLGCLPRAMIEQDVAWLPVRRPAGVASETASRED